MDAKNQEKFINNLKLEWVRFQADILRHLLTLSILSIGFLGAMSSTLRLWTVIPMVCFALVILISLVIYHFDAKSIQRVIESKEPFKFTKYLQYIVYIAFFIGIVSFVVIIPLALPSEMM